MSPKISLTLLSPKAMARVLMLLLCASVAVFAQTSSATDGTTPLGLSPGAPAGSYLLSGFDNINPYNGNLNFHLPLLGIGGRGTAATASVLAIDAKSWSVKHKPVADGETLDSPTYNWWSPKPGYGPGLLVGRQSGFGTWNCGPFQPKRYIQTLTRLTFTAGDGTEYEFRDQLTAGEPATPGSCNPPAPSRGTVFITADGTAATFISDTTIYDQTQIVNALSSLIYPSGYLMLRDGTRFRIDGGNVTWMRDRNGNKLSFTYDASHRVLTITDSVNRQVTFTYADYLSTFSDQITFKGFGGANRTILINHTTLDGALRTTNPRNEPPSRYQIQTYRGLFPELNNASSSTNFNAFVVSSVTLPNGRQYQFFYNCYSELARVNLPTGGAIEYDYTAGSGADSDMIYRRVIERRVYADGISLEGYTTFSDLSSGVATVDQLSASGTLLARTKHYFYGNPRNSFGATGISYPGRFEGREYKTESYAADGVTLLRSEQMTWANRAPISWSWYQCCTEEPPNDPRVTDTTATLADVTPNLVAKHVFGYDDTVPYNNRNNVKEYDFGSGAPGALVRETRTTYVILTNYTDASGAHLRSLPTQTSVYDAGGIERARTTFEYDNYSAESNHAALVDRPSISGLDSAFNTSYSYRGNATGTTRYLLVNGSVTGSISAYVQYDIAGNAVKAIDARGNATNFYFADCFGAPNGEALTNTPPYELGSLFSYAAITSVTRASQTVYTQYDYYTGRPVDGQDVNGIVSSGYSNDLLDRPTQVVRGANLPAPFKSQSTFSYDDVNRIITTTSDLNSYNDPNPVKGQAIYDGLGRTIETRAYENSTEYIAVRQVPFIILQDPASGAWVGASQTSNPFRPYLNEQPLWTTTFVNSIDRSTKIRTPDNAIARTSYSGNSVTVTDQIGKSRKSVSDALGRLITVYEDPSGANYQTSYSYDVLDNLTTVSQGVQTRTFVYDSLKRLTSATNPESGTVTYGYDNNGNLTSKLDARNITTTLAYDVLNRITSKSYNDNPQTPTVNFYYDAQTLPAGAPSFTRGPAIGRLVAMTYGANSSAGDYYGFDSIGRTAIKIQQTGSINYQTTFGYNVAGAVTSQTYPSGHTVSYAFDQAGRLSSFTGNLGDGTNRDYSTGIIYSSLGGMAKEQFGTTTPIYNKLFYNSRGQLSEIRDSTSYTGPGDTSWNRGAIINHYSFQCWGACNGTDNNGNLKKQEVYVPDNDQITSYTSWYQQYTYDSLNRLTQVNEYTGNPSLDWQQKYIIDRYGNRTIDVNNTSPNIPRPAFNVDVSTNRLTVPGGQVGVMSYDNAGNLITDSYTGGGGRTYDAENRMTSAQGSSSSSNYTYDGEGKRIRRSVTTGTGKGATTVETWQVYGLGGELLAEYPANGSPSTPQKEYGYRNGQLLVTAGPSANIRWLVTDHLGTPRMIFDQSGSLANVSRHDYLPFGEELFAGTGGRTTAQGYTANDGVRQHFTLQERDMETGLDYMHARYYANAQGRFTTPDTLLGSLTNPQTLNRYAYVGNNPLSFSDPTGHTRFIPASENGFAEMESDNGGGYMYPDSLAPIGLPDRYEAEIARVKAVFAEEEEAGANTKGPDDTGGTDGKAAEENIDDPAQQADSTTSKPDPQEPSSGQGDIDVVRIDVNVGKRFGVTDSPAEVLILHGSHSIFHPNPWGHMAYLIDGTVYSWEGGGKYTRYDLRTFLRINRRYRSITGYVLDFGSIENVKFKELLLGAYDGNKTYGPFHNNCGEAFCRAMNALGGRGWEAGMSPSDHEGFINSSLRPQGYVKETHYWPYGH
jgi:RHS repeat-associated protein